MHPASNTTKHLEDTLQHTIIRFENVSIRHEATKKIKKVILQKQTGRREKDFCSAMSFRPTPFNDAIK